MPISFQFRPRLLDAQYRASKAGEVLELPNAAR